MVKFFLIVLIAINVMALNEANRPHVYDVNNAEELYKDFIKKHNRTFEFDWEYKNRLNNFQTTLKKINEYNVRNGPRGSIVGPDKFADYSAESYSKMKELQRQKIDPDLELVEKMQNTNRNPIVKSLFNKKYNWTYPNAMEENRGLKNFINNANKVSAMNEKEGGKDIFFVITKYADMDSEDMNEHFAIDIKTYVNSKDPKELNYLRNNKRVNLHNIRLYDLTNSKQLYHDFKNKYKKVKAEKHARRKRYLRFLKTLVEINRNNFAGNPPMELDENADIVKAPNDFL